MEETKKIAEMIDIDDEIYVHNVVSYEYSRALADQDNTLHQDNNIKSNVHIGIDKIFDPGNDDADDDDFEENEIYDNIIDPVDIDQDGIDEEYSDYDEIYIDYDNDFDPV